MKSLVRLSLFAVAVANSWSAVAAAEVSAWPSWRGTSGAGLAPADAKPPLTWSDTANIKWKARVPGLGFSTPIIWRDRIFLLTAIESGADPLGSPVNAQVAGTNPKPTKPYEFVVLAFDRGSGKIVWQKTANKTVPHEGHQPNNTFASASPTTDGENLYVSFGSRGFYCYDLDGNLKWEKDLGDYRSRMGFGEAITPVLAHDLLIINWDHEDQDFIVALNKRTGAEVWRTKRDEPSSWSTPLVVDFEGRRQVIVPASRRTCSYDLATGELIWEASGLTGNCIPMPVVGHGMVYVMSGFRGFSVQAIKLSSRGDVSDTNNIVWSHRRGTPYVPSPVLSGDRLYFNKSNDAYLSCLNALTGEHHYSDQPLPGVVSIYASPLAANGHIYIVGREGTTLVLKDQPKFEIVATNKLNDRIDASPVMLERELYLRGYEYLYAIAE